jgi:hypothetical protein
MEIPNYNYYPEYYEKKYFSNIRDQQWVPLARHLFEDKQKQLNFYYNNQEFIESHKKVMNYIHMGYINMMYKPLNEIDSSEDEDYTVYKYLNSEPLSFYW